MDLTELLAASAASQAFKDDALAYAAGHQAPRIQLVRRSPAIKVLRVLAQLLDSERDLAIEDVVIDARSGCSDFLGVISVRAATGTRTFEFSWDCGWRAEQENWRDVFGFPDQIRAAREYGWRCFRVWRRVAGMERVTEALAS